jgi:hypothetical protein
LISEGADIIEVFSFASSKPVPNVWINGEADNAAALMPALVKNERLFCFVDMI